MADTTLHIEKVILHRLEMELKHSFSTSFGTVHKKDFLLVEVIDTEGRSGYGESVAFSAPWYTEETTETVLHIIQSFLLPIVFEKSMNHPDELAERFRLIRRNPMAKAAVEGAIWDLYAKIKQQPLACMLGGTRQEINVGVSIGVQDSTEKMLQHIAHFQQQGYSRFKVKIKPGKDIEIIRNIRKAFPELQLMADANSAYTLDEARYLQQLDEFGLIMIEQPLGHNDFTEHAALQKRVKTPICLDESIASFHDAKQAIELGACQVINLKIGRVGGLTEARRIHDLAVSHEIPVWCGGMLEGGVGRAHSLAISSLSGFIYPGDTSGSDRYWEKDIIQPEVRAENGVIQLSNHPGIGYEIDWKRVEEVLKERITISNSNRQQ